MVNLINVMDVSSVEDFETYAKAVTDVGDNLKVMIADGDIADEVKTWISERGFTGVRFVKSTDVPFEIEVINEDGTTTVNSGVNAITTAMYCINIGTMTESDAREDYITFLRS